MTFFDNIKHVVVIGILIHILLLVTVFDTYFKSPLEHNLVPVKSTHNPPARRVVLFVADGLRAQTLYDQELNTPFLNLIRRTKSSWGVSHTRVPTESRPGHVAILAGIYEDPSAIFKGWKHNPVEFDSVIKQSKKAYCWGSPDIVPLFHNGERHVRTYSYSSELQDFGNKDTSILDSWVFDKTEEFILSLKKDSEEVIRDDGVVYFLHLLGTDTAGHAFKPYSEQYIKNIEMVDIGVGRIAQLFGRVFPDNRTAFVFTSDHGMTDWGSHGSGLDVETNTPVIAWGAGIRREKKRNDIRQIDLAPLLSSLIGINYPSNSLGKLPLSYLNVTDPHKLYLANILQVFKIFDSKRLKILKSTFFYKPYSDLTAAQFEKIFEELSNRSDINRCHNLLDVILKGIEYYDNYFTGNILVSVSMGLVLWMIYLATFLVNENVFYEKNVSSYEVLLKIYFILVVLLCFTQSQPFLYYLYFSFPCLSLYLLLKKHNRVICLIIYVKQFNTSNLLQCVSYILCTVLFIYGFYQRFLFSFTMLLISLSVFSAVYPSKIEKFELYCWLIFSIFLAVFPMLPLMNTSFQLMLHTSGFILWQILSLFCIWKFQQYRSVNILKIQLLFSWLAYGLAILTVNNIIDNTSTLKYLSSIVAVVPVLLITFTERFISLRLFSIIQSLFPYYVMTSTSYELLFLNVYIINLTLWLRLETRNNLFSIKFGEEIFVTKNFCFRKCFTFVSFILLGFFGTGNMASLNSFDPMWVRCFLTVFSPFKMTCLIILKLIIPFIIAACVFRSVVFLSGLSLVKTFCAILIISDCMVFFFLYHIKNVGSWLDIGMSLSHFIVVEMFSIVIILLYVLAFCLTNVHYNQFRIVGFKKYDKYSVT